MIPKQQKWVKDSYYKAYFMSLHRSAKYIGMQTVIGLNSMVWCCPKNAFSATLNDKQFIMDFSDLKPFQLSPKDFDCPYFKWHYSYDTPAHEACENVRPLCVLQDYDWAKFGKIRVAFQYNASGNIVTNNQRIRGAAKGRRYRVQRILSDKYSMGVSLGFVDQVQWWLSHENCLAAVHVPGARNDMLDRGQLELMGLGVCVISPEIVTVLAGYRTLEPFKHYVPVEPSYCNLIEMVEWCRTHRAACKQIGENAKRLFNEVAYPSSYWAYIREVLGV
jgi:hypothetical protein